MSERKWTQQQLKFIEAERGPVLVSAAAGSGKTAAIVERVSRRLSDKTNPLKPSRLLMTTFSIAAADEMISRIEEEMQNRLDREPDDFFLQQQVEQMQEANISTIHSLCFKIIRENFSHLGLFCDFKVADDTEKKTLMQSAMERVIRRVYENNDPELYKLVELLCSSRSDYELMSVITRLYETVIAMPFPEDVLDRWLENFAPTEESYKKWADIMLSHCEKYVEYVIELAYKHAQELGDYESFPFAAADLELAKQLKEKLCEGDVEGLYNLSAAAAAPKGFVTFGGKMDPELKEMLKISRNKLKDAVKELASCLAYVGKESYFDDQRETFGAISLLFSLVRDFMDEFANAKRDRNVLDFSDAEQFALRLLWQKDNSGGYVKSPLAKELKCRFDEIYIDEYQDVNNAQEMIFEAIAPESGNIFMVGDVKQSIYAFRQADAEIFEDKKQSYAPYDGVHFPAKIFFDSNFRSREGVTEFVNQIFRKLMTPENCKSSYTDDDSLKSKAEYPPNELSGTEFLFFESESGTREKTWAADEARVIAAEIKSLVESGYSVKDSEMGQRPCRYSDFCILVRSDGGKFAAYAQELENLGIMAEVGGADENFFETREILLTLSILKAINNPYDDIALCAAMMSPLFLFSPADLAQLKSGNNRKKALFDAVKSVAEEGSDRYKEFMKSLRSLQRLASAQSVDSLLSCLYEKYGLYYMVGAMNGGEARMGNLDILRYYSRSFEKNGYKGLSDFLRFLDRIQNSDISLASVGSSGEKTNAVSIMTIHKSKGLEFPICFVAGTVARFNTMDLSSRIMIDKELGFASVITDDKNAISYSPLTYRALQLKAEQSQIAEEMRVLYVALTRAKEKLIIPIVRSDIGKALSQAAADAGVKNNTYAVYRNKSFAKWLLLCTANGVSMKKACAKFESDALCSEQDCGFSVKVVSQIEEKAEAAEQPIERVASDSELIERLRESARFEYPFKAQSSIPSKFSVSELSKGADEGVFDFDTKPDFMHEQSMSGAARGTALHTFMQFANFENAKRDVEAELISVRDKGHITEKQREAVELSRLKAFFESELCKRILAADAVFREYKFMTGVDSSQFGGERTADDTVVLQGIADCVIIEGGTATIIDYKTDFVKVESELVERYGMQLAIYRGAIEKLLGIPIKECLIYSFCLGKEIRVETEQNIF